MVAQITTDLTPVPNAMEPGTFSSRTDAFLPKLPTWASEANALAVEAKANAVIAAASVEEILSTANFQGAWTAKAYAAYVSVAYLDLFWMSNAITAAGDVPGISTKWILLSRNTGFKNFIINGNFDFWQRGTGFTASGYTADRWTTENATNTICERVTKSDGRYGLRFARGTGTTAYQYVEQRIELPRYMVGKTMNLSFKIKFNVASPIFNITCKWFTDTTTGISVASIDKTDTTTEQTFTRSFVVPDGTDFSYFRISLVGNGATGTDEYDFEISQVQLERGSVRTEFENRPLALERALCERYYHRIDATNLSPFGTGYHYATTSSRILTKFPTAMRIAPTALLQSGTASDYAVMEDTTAVSCNSVPTFGIANREYAMTSFPVASGLTAGKGTYARATTTTYLAWSAEL